MHGLFWWQWWRARRRLGQWVRGLIGSRPYTVEFRTAGASYCDFSHRLIVVQPDLPRTWGVATRAIPPDWGRVHVGAPAQLEVLCARAVAYHEAGHVLFTEPVVATGQMHHTLVNILEDEREERLLARYAPSTATDLYELGHRFWLEGFPRVPDRPTRLLNATLFHRWDNDRPRGARSRLVLSDPVERTDWEERLKPLVEQAWEATDTRRVAELALEILAIIGVPPDAEPDRFPGLIAAGPDAPPEGERAPDDQPLPPGTTGWGGGVQEGSQSGLGHDPDVEGAIASEAPDADPSHGILWMQPYADLERQVGSAVRRLQEQLRVRAPDVEEEPNRHRGRLDARACVHSRGERPLVRPALEGDSPAELAILLAIDGTGSNGNNPGGVTTENRPERAADFTDPQDRMVHVRAATMLLQRACAGLGIPCAIAEVCDKWHRVHNPLLPSHAPSVVTWLQRFDTNPDAEGPRALIAGLYGHAGREEVCKGLRILAPHLLARPEGTKLLIYLHDGQPNDAARIPVTLAEVRAQGILVLGL
jgi:hypothetical protein